MSRPDPNSWGAIEPSDDDDGTPCRVKVKVKVVTRGVAATLLAFGASLFYMAGEPQAHPALSVSCGGIVQTLAIAPDRRTIYACCSDGSLLTWRPGSLPSRVGDFDERAMLPHVSLTPDGLTIAGFDCDGSVSLWDLAAGRRLSRIPPRIGSITALAFSDDSTTLALADDSGVRLLETSSGLPLAGLRLDLYNVTSLAFAPDGRTLAVGGRDGTIRLWKPVQGGPLLACRAHRTAVNSLEFADDGTVLASMSHRDNVARLWQSSKARLLAEFDAHSNIQAITLAPGGRLLAAAGRDEAIRVWDTVAGRPCRVVQDHEGVVTALAFASGGSRLACGGAGWIRLYDVKNDCTNYDENR